jgi:ribosomal protein S18 acetylase RimI-like enzyme
MRRHIEDTWGWDDAWQRRDFQQRFERCAIQVIENDQSRIGSLWLKEDSATIFIADIQILPEWQGQRIGTAVLRGVIAQAMTSKRDVELVVLPVNERARRLYERMGFQTKELRDPFVHMRYRVAAQD